jgi:hypothetical protein
MLESCQANQKVTFPKLHMPDSAQLKAGSALSQRCARHPMSNKQVATADLNFIALLACRHHHEGNSTLLQLRQD